MRYNITIVIDKNILPQLLNKKKEVRTMGKKNKKSDKKLSAILLITAIIQLITAIAVAVQQVLQMMD